LLLRAGMEERSVLVVDDGSLMRWALVKELSTSGYFVDSAATGAGALRTLRERRHWVAFLAIHLADVNGLDLLPRFREISPGTRIVVLSGDGSAQNKRRAFREGAWQFIEKPFEMADLRTVLTSVPGVCPEKRRHGRCFCRLPLRISVISPSPEEASLDLRNLSGITVDLGQGGVGLRTAYGLRKGRFVRLSPLDGEAPCARFIPPGSTAEVVWIAPQPGGSVAGLRWIEGP